MSAIPGAFGKRFQCPCCNNPWNQTDEGSIGTIFCDPCLADDKGYQGIDPKNFDHAESPKDNFYLWSNGGWRASNPIPEEYSSWNTFIALRDLNLERLKVILDELGDAGALTDSGRAKLADFYSSFMDEEAIESRGLSVLSGLRDLCSQTDNLAHTVASLHSVYGVDVFFGMGSSPDKGNSQHSLGSLRQGGLGLPDRDYYFDASKAEKRDKYVAYITQIFKLLGEDAAFPEYQDAAFCAGLARAILDFEAVIAATHLTRTASRDPQTTYNKMSVAELVSKSQPQISWPQYLTGGCASLPSFDWHAYFEAVGKGAEVLGDINVSSLDAVSKSPSFMRGPLLPHYMLFHCVNGFAQHLPKAFVDAHFTFFQQELMGTQQQQPRWKRALGALESALGDKLGQLYVAKHFPADAKERALAVVESVREALEERLLEVKWMGEATRVEAMAKMRKFKVKIGFPDRWVDYSTLPIQRGLHMENVVAARSFAFRLEVSRMNAPTDLFRWYMTPQTVNAYFHPSLNEIVFPAAILQPPFFDASADAAVQFGSLGAVVGHEMSHGFDDQGRKYDSLGNLRDWWAGNDGAEYEKRANKMIQQAEKFEVHGLPLNGKLTAGENIADLGGVKLALRALKRHLATELAISGTPAPLINGFSPEQRLFLAWSQAWRENVKKERAIQLVTLDPHGPNELRCNGTLSNVPEFLQAFGIVEGDKMYLAAEEQVDIW